MAIGGEAISFQRMSLKETFLKAAKVVQTLPKRPANDELLELYGLYKQSTEQDVQGARPGFLDVQGRAKFDAWARKKGIASDVAMQEYVALVERLKKKYL